MDNKEKTLALDEAYDAMVDYLEKYYEKNKSDDVGALLDSMMLLADDIPFDVVVLDDWNDSVCKIKSQKIQDIQELTIKEAYDIMIDYLDLYRDRTNSKEVASLLSDMKILDDKKNTNVFWHDWINSVDKILNQNPRIRPRLVLTMQDKYK